LAELEELEFASAPTRFEEETGSAPGPAVMPRHLGQLRPEPLFTPEPPPNNQHVESFANPPLQEVETLDFADMMEYDENLEPPLNIQEVELKEGPVRN